MPDETAYELLDFGEGRKLERFGSRVVDRPSPAAKYANKHRPRLWAGAHLHCHESAWCCIDEPRDFWRYAHGDVATGGFLLELKRTPFGHVGVFPEQAENWGWLAAQVRRAPEPVSVLNLFAYTGAATLAAAAAGAAVTHVDAAQSTVNWARSNAALSGLAEAPIRWIADDALKFARRELKRGKTYHGVILDPPTYGHGAAGESWQLAEHLPELLALCAELLRAKLTSPTPRFMLLTCHTSEIGPEELTQLVAEAFGRQAASRVKAAHLFLVTAAGRRLHAGTMARFASE